MSAGPVTRIFFHCVRPECRQPAEWRIEYTGGQFSTACDPHYRALLDFWPQVAARSRKLEPDESLPVGCRGIFVTVPVAGYPGFTVRRMVGGRQVK